MIGERGKARGEREGGRLETNTSKQWMEEEGVDAEIGEVNWGRREGRGKGESNHNIV